MSNLRIAILDEKGKEVSKEDLTDTGHEEVKFQLNELLREFL